MQWLKSLFQEEQKSSFMKRHFFKQKEAFKNPFVFHSKRNMIGMLMWALGCYRDRQRAVPIPKGFCYPNHHEPIQEDKPQVTWVNHSTFMIKLWCLTFLTDPIWNERCQIWLILVPF